MSAPLLEAFGVSKHFQGVQAVVDVSASFHRGEIVAVMGENGAGKSTLMKLLAGVHRPDAGRIAWEGREREIPDVRTANALGIAFIHQELNLAENLSVAANVFLGREPTRLVGLLDQAEMNRRTRVLLDDLGAAFEPEAAVGELSLGHRQMVEIAKALSQEAKLLIMDEPTSSLSPRETERLFELMRDLQARGLCLVFISHRIAEVEAVADRVIVLRDGRNSGALDKAAISRERIVNLMVGRDLDLPLKELVDPGAERLRVDRLRTARFPSQEVSFALRAGEIVGLAGLVGAGRTEVLRAVFGLDRPLGGTVSAEGSRLPPGRPRSAIRAGVAFVPEDRKREGVITDLAVRENIAMAGLGRFQVAGWVNDRAVNRLAELITRHLSIRASRLDQAVGQLSGGNQQKVAIGKWLALQPNILLLDEPTRGVDVGAKAEIYETVERLAEKGVAVLFVSSDLEEILRLSDRVIVMHDGRLAGELTRDNAFSEQSIMRLATGGS